MSYGEGGTAPRVNKKTLGAYIGRTVALVGAVESHMPTAVVLRTSVRCWFLSVVRFVVICILLAYFVVAAVFL